MSATVTLTPGEVPLADWRAIYRGGRGGARPGSARAAVEASAAAVAAHRRARRAGLRHQHRLRQARQRPHRGRRPRDAPAQHRAVATPPASASRCRAAVVRLMMALKLASLAQGASGVRPATIDAARGACWRTDLHARSIPAQGLGRRLGRPRAARAHGGGDDRRGRRASRRRGVPAAAGARARPGSSRWRSGRRRGWRCSTARSSRRPMRWPGCSRPSALFARGAGHGRALDRCGARARTRRSMPRIHALRRHRGQIEVAAALRGADGRQRHPRRRTASATTRVQDPYCLRCQPQVMGAVPRPAAPGGARRSATEANGVSDNPLIFAETGEALSGGNFHAEPVAFAADMIALARLRDRLASPSGGSRMLVDPALSGLPAFLTPRAGPQFRLHDRRR